MCNSHLLLTTVASLPTLDFNTFLYIIHNMYNKYIHICNVFDFFIKERTVTFSEKGDDSECAQQEKVTVAMLPLRLGFQKLLDIFDALLRRHSHNVVQSVHVAQHLHNLFQQLPESTWKKTSYPTRRTKQNQLESCQPPLLFRVLNHPHCRAHLNAFDLLKNDSAANIWMYSSVAARLATLRLP